MYFSEPLSKPDLLVMREKKEEERCAIPGVDRYTRRRPVGGDTGVKYSPGINYLLLLAYHRQGFDAKGDRPVDCCLKGQIDPLSGFSFCSFFFFFIRRPLFSSS